MWPIAIRPRGSRLGRTRRSARGCNKQWLGFIGTELHKAVFVPLLDARAPEDVKRYARDTAPLRLDVLQDHLAQREYLLDAFSVGDAYRVTVLN
ncbi:MAG: glutathione S-transferase [Paraburkholderia sp.]|nr:glutathione S-transferase [Paraburkholderia sp.]